VVVGDGVEQHVALKRRFVIISMQQDFRDRCLMHIEFLIGAIGRFREAIIVYSEATC
jgi:hypothetical protein